MSDPFSAVARPRPPAVAGRFYPDDPDQLLATVDDFLAAGAARAPADSGPLRALIVPHAGYPFSGPVAGTGYACLRLADGSPRKRVVLVGPAHRWPVQGLAVPASSAFITPLGGVRVDTEALAALLDRDLAHVVDAAHVAEHALEVQLPFLQRVLGDGFGLVPLVAGEATPAQVEAVLDALWDGPETLVVVSSDLSHFLDYETARRLDAATSRAIETMAGAAIPPEGACGRVPIQGLLAAAARRGLTARTVDLRSSGDTAGDRSRVVGYGAYVLG